MTCEWSTSGHEHGVMKELAEMSFPSQGVSAQPEETRLSGGAQRRTAAPNVERRQLKQFSIFSGCPNGSSLWRCSGHIQQRGGSRSDTVKPTANLTVC